MKCGNPRCQHVFCWLCLHGWTSATHDASSVKVASKPAEEIEEEDTESVDLYNGSFSLACGTLTLLRDTKMHFKRNRFYGLLGPNQCGKTTLRHAIANEQLEGFPKRDELKSVFVEHEIEDEEVGVQDDGFQIVSVDISFNNEYEWESKFPDGGAGANVYVFDTGFNVNNGDFGGRAINRHSCLSLCAEVGSCTDNDAHGHGTHVAGPVAGHQYGVAKHATIHGMQVIGSDGRGHRH